MAGKTAATQDNFIGGWAWIHSTTADALARTSPLYLYMQLTGPYKTEEYTRRDNELTAAQKAIVENPDLMGPLLVDLFEFFHIASYKKLLGKYTAGQITPELQKILNYQPRVYETTIDIALNGGDFSEIVLQAVKAGKLDFTPFNDTEDKALDWFLKYRLAPTPIPGYFGSIANINARAGLAAGTLDTYTGKIKKAIKIHIKNILDAGTPADTLREVTKEVRERYGIVKKKCEINNDNSIMNSVFPFVSPRMAGFAVDVKAGIIFDLRPHAEELRNALAPGAEPLRAFYILANRYIQNYQKAKREPGSLFGNEPFIPLRNTPESNAVTSITGGITAMAIQSELAFTDENGTPLYNYETSVPIKSGDVIIKISETPKGRALRPSTQKLKILCDALFTRRSNRNLVFNVNEYMELCETPDTKEAKREFKKTLRQNLRTLNKTSFSLKSSDIVAGEVSILSSWIERKDGTMQITLTPEYCAVLQGRRSGIFSITEYVYRSDERNVHIIPFIIKLHWNRQMYKNVNRSDRRKNTISMKSLIEADPDLLMKCKKNINRESRRYIIDPTIKVINILNKDKVIVSKFVDSDGIEHTQQELNTVTLGDFMNPEKWLLFYDIVGYKDDPQQIQAAKDRAANREETKIKNAYKKGFKAGKKKAEQGQQ